MPDCSAAKISPAGQVGHRGAELAPDLPAEAGGAEAQALDVGDARSARCGTSRPPGCRCRRTGSPGRRTGRRSRPRSPGRRGSAPRPASSRLVMPNGTPVKKREALALVLPVVGGAVAHLGRAVDDGVERTERRHHFAGGVDAGRSAGRPTASVMRSARRCAPTPRPGKFLGQVVTMRQLCCPARSPASPARAAAAATAVRAVADLKNSRLFTEVLPGRGSRTANGTRRRQPCRCVNLTDAAAAVQQRPSRMRKSRRARGIRSRHRGVDVRTADTCARRLPIGETS